jgi:Spirocyclase AveC-like
MATASAPAEPVTAAPERARPVPPVIWWAAGGAVALVFMVWVLARWVTGPDFESVPVGPTEPPTWMKALLIFWQAFACVGTLTLLWIYLIRPWRREGVVRTDGLLVIAAFLIWFQDPLSACFGDWFTWNTYLLNMGSWVTSVPGSMSVGEPGAQVVEPILGGPIWVFIAWAGIWFGSWVLRVASTRWPHLSAGVLVVFVLFPAMMLFDVVLEGLVAIPSGLYVYPGSHFALFPEAYNKYPLHEAAFAGATLAGLAALRFFVNDRGETVVERGVSDLSYGTGSKVTLRLLALICATQLIPLVTYNLPTGWVAGAHSASWPEAVQSQSYFTAGLCGYGTNRICPQDGVPLKDETVNIAPNGDLVIPADSAAARVLGLPSGEERRIGPGVPPLQPVPQDHTDASPFTGPLLGNTD